MIHRKTKHSEEFPVRLQMPKLCVRTITIKNHFTLLTEDMKAKRISELVSTDVCGPSKSVKFDGKNYVTFINHSSHVSVVYLIERKMMSMEKRKLKSSLILLPVAKIVY